ncbi:MAG TPA: hypothetical protein VNG90_04770 [Candidatus Acidoferrum sp.]|nr:hypothetical protein [Candidatus Acidoferrum sp.]
MENIVIINERVAVAAAFSAREGRLVCYPAKMRWRGRVITFSELGLRHPTVKGKRMVHVFDMTDGEADYRLEFDAERLTWMLASILEGHYDAARA